MKPEPAGGYTLVALFLLVTTAAVVLALVRAAQANEDNRSEELLSGAAVAGAFLGAFLGAWRGFCYSQSRSSVVVGAFSGCVTGAACGYIAAAGARLWLFAAGGAGLLALALAAKLTRRRSGPTEQLQDAGTSPAARHE